MTSKPPAVSGSMIRDLRRCERNVALDIHGTPAMREPVSAFTRMLWHDGLDHEAKILNGLGEGVIDMRGLRRPDWKSGTESAIQAQVPVILGSVIEHADLIGMPDLLRWTPAGYYASDVKNGAPLDGPRQNYKQDYLVQVAHYAHILTTSGLGRGDVAGIVARNGVETIYDLSVPLGRDRKSGFDLHIKLLDRVRQVRADGDMTKGALLAICTMCEWKSFCRRELTAAPGGANSIEWYDRFVETGDVALRDRIVAYNRDDVIASQVVRDALNELETTGMIAAFERPAK